MEQRLAFCTVPGGARLAYATYGNDSAPALVVAKQWFSQEWVWRHPEGRAFFEDLGSMRRLITFDLRGMGASQPAAPRGSIEESNADLLALMDHLQLSEAALFWHGSSPAAFAAAHTDRVERIVLWGPRVRYPARDATQVAMIRDAWNMYTRLSSSIIFPEGSAQDQRWVSDASRGSVKPEYLLGDLEAFDYEEIFLNVRCPALILHRVHDQNTTVDEARRVAALIPESTYVGLPGAAHHPMWGRGDYMPVLRDFLGAPSEAPHGTAMAVILFVDIADSTALTERLGDAAFRDKARALDERLRACVREHGGRVIDAKTLGDGILATFPAASQAISAALACRAAGDANGLLLHMGLHAGDIVREAGNVFGGAVNTAARISALSAPGDLLVSDIVRGLARTSSGVSFEDRGEHALKGITEPQRVYAVVARAT